MVKEIQQLHHSQPITPAELERAKANAKVDFASQNETAAGLADSLAHGLTTPWKYLFNNCYSAFAGKDFTRTRAAGIGTLVKF